MWIIVQFSSLTSKIDEIRFPLSHETNEFERKKVSAPPRDKDIISSILVKPLKLNNYQNMQNHYIKQTYPYINDYTREMFQMTRRDQIEKIMFLSEINKHALLHLAVIIEMKSDK